MLPLDTSRPYALRSLSRLLDQGRDVVLFPQGTGIGDPDRPDRPGVAWLLERVDCRIMEITLSHNTRLPRIERFGEVRSDIPPEQRAIERRGIARSSVAAKES